MTRTLPPFYYFANSVLRQILFPLMRVQVTVKGQENVPREGALILVSNHLSLVDPPLLGTFIPRDLVMMSKAENFDRGGLSRWVTSNYGAFPIRRGAGDVGAIRHAMKVLKQGQALYIAPEGTRSITGYLREPQEGVALLAVRSNVPIVPVGISGIEHFHKRVKRWQATPVHLSIGLPFRLRSPEPRPDRAMLEALSEAVMQRIAAELPLEYRGRFQETNEAQHLVELLA
ncbi:MAG: 1-acyl-sn-glycerol-3-phosphate acyltransferase [Ardenticatenales bacterium]|nr:1-acyl-sn-glycerol-3-phosphate acyltransferase [Ardenticatenales bacterium]